MEKKIIINVDGYFEDISDKILSVDLDYIIWELFMYLYDFVALYGRQNRQIRAEVWNAL